MEAPEAPPEGEADAPAAPVELAPAETWGCQLLVLRSGAGLRGLASRLPGTCGLARNGIAHTATVSAGCLRLGPQSVPLSPDCVLDTLTVDTHTALVLHHTDATPPTTYTLFGFDSDERRASLAAAVLTERDTRRFPKAAALPDGFATALVCSLWRHTQSAALLEAYYHGWGGDDGQRLFCSLWRVFTSLLPPEAYDPACGASPQAAGRAADAFTQLLSPVTQADALARLLLLSPQWGPCPDSLATWARTPAPDARDFAKLVTCMDSGARALHRAKPPVLPLLLGLSAEVAAVPPTSPAAASLFGPHATEWFAACAARDAMSVATSSIDRFLLCVSPVAALYAATAAAARSDAASLQLALVQSSGAERLAGLLDLDPMASLSAVLFSVPHTTGQAFLRRCAMLLVAPDGEAGAVHAPCVVLAVTRWGVAQGRLRATFHILESILFEPDAVTLTSFGAAALQPDADMQLCELLAGAIAACVSSTQQADLLCGLLELVLRCANAVPPPASPAPAPKGSPAARCDPAFLATLPSLPPRLWPALASKLQFTRYLMRVHALSADAMSQPGSSRGGGFGPDSSRGPDSMLRASPDATSPLSSRDALPGVPDSTQGGVDDGDSCPPSTSEAWVMTWHSRSRDAALAACLSYVALCVRQRPSALQHFLVTAPDWQGTLLSTPANRSLLAAALTASPQYRLLWPAAVTSLVDGDTTGLLRHHSHWHPDALRALCLPSVVAQGANLVADAPRLCPRIKETDDELPAFASPSEGGGEAQQQGSGVAAQRQRSIAEQFMDGGRQLFRDMRRRDTVEESVGEVPQDALETPGGEDDGETQPPPSAKIPDMRLLRISIANAMRRRSSSAPSGEASAPTDEAPAAEGAPVAESISPPVAALPPQQEQQPAGGGFMARFRRRKTVEAPAADTPPPGMPQPEVVASPEGGDMPADEGAPAAPPSAPRLAAPPGIPPLESEQAASVSDAAEQRMQDAQLVFELVELGLYLKKAARLDGDVIDLFVNMNDQRSESAGSELHKRSVLMLLEDVRQRRIAGKTGDFFDSRRAGRPAVLDMGTINECACFARDALAMLASQVRPFCRDTCHTLAPVSCRD